MSEYIAVSSWREFAYFYAGIAGYRGESCACLVGLFYFFFTTSMQCLQVTQLLYKIRTNRKQIAGTVIVTVVCE